MFDLTIHKRFGDFQLEVAGRSDARVLGIVGPSGSGKSTLLNVVAGFVRPDEAHVVVADQAFASHGGPGVPIRRRGVGYVCQEPLLFPHLSVRGNLRYGQGAHGHGPTFDEVVDLLDLRPLLTRRPVTLSGGEARRTAIARAVLSAPRVLLLDEPLAGLDAELAARTLALLHRVKSAFHIPTLYVSHTTSDVVFLCDEAWQLEGGRLVGRGAPRELLADIRARHTPTPSDLRNYFLARRDRGGADGGCVFRVGDQRLVLAEPPNAPCASTEIALLTVHASDMILAREKPNRLSARNILNGRVVGVSERDGDVLVTVDVGERWVVRVTPAAVRDLRLAPDVDLFVIIKASAISAVPA